MCTCEDVDWSAHDFTSESTRTARKSHTCIECASVIRPGERYIHVAMKWDGHIATHSLCLGCDAWGKAFLYEQNELCGCSGWTVGDMWKAIAAFPAERAEHEQILSAELARKAVLRSRVEQTT